MHTWRMLPTIIFEILFNFLFLYYEERVLNVGENTCNGLKYSSERQRSMLSNVYCFQKKKNSGEIAYPRKNLLFKTS